MFRLAGPLQWGTSAVVLACVLLILWLLSRPLRRRR
jgi:5'-nucleotidase/UDP-sugar diphosphatase